MRYGGSLWAVQRDQWIAGLDPVACPHVDAFDPPGERRAEP